MRIRVCRKCLSILLFVGLGALSANLLAAETLFELMDRRLALMADVAAYKWHHQQPVEDAAREAVVVAEAADLALRHGLVPQTVERLFLVQIEAAKEIQRYWFGQWQAAGAGVPVAPDLAATVRPELLRLGEAIVAAAAQRHRGAGSPPRLDRATFDGQVTTPGLSTESLDALYGATLRIEAYPHRLAQILATGRLRIGTTGDYAPFSHRDDGATAFSGIDIDLGHDLAESLGVQAEFVLTSWPGLLADLAAGHFDIAMSGVSRTLPRQRLGFLSQPYYVDGKTPIARCADRRRFGSLAGIDRPGVRVVVNPGGTNERFLDEQIRVATKVLHPDNRTIFAEILEGRADVMFTDRIEVELQRARNPALCSTMKGNLTYQEKAYLMPQDPHWLAFVDTWLALRLAEGRVDAVFLAHGFERGGGAAGARSVDRRAGEGVSAPRSN